MSVSDRCARVLMHGKLTRLIDYAQGRRWTVIASFDLLTEILLVLAPACLVWPLQMPMKLKLQVVSAFAFRLG